MIRNQISIQDRLFLGGVRTVHVSTSIQWYCVSLILTPPFHFLLAIQYTSWLSYLP